ncbi:MAG: hypothetical protein BWK76_20870 [Desulfobulbaceae bacterium A2]|nr:MAG: hypothetical protein BWK76_20870 [Desulfobulbaceae bacterium A2]
MPSLRVVLSVVDVKRCPYYQAGDLFVLGERAVELPTSAPACLILVRELTSLLFQLLPGGSRPSSDGPFTCGGCSGIIRFRRIASESHPAVSDEELTISGALEAISPAELLQVFHLHQKSGVLQLDLQGGPAEVVFRGGHLVAAQYAGTTGSEAIFAILRGKTGRFRFMPRLLSGPGTALLGDFMAILMEGLKRIDEVTPSAGGNGDE